MTVNTHTAHSLLTFAEQARASSTGLDAKAVFAQLENRYEALLAALDCFVAQGLPDEARRLAVALAPFWMMTKRLAEGSALLQSVLEAPGGEDGPRGRASFEAGLLALWQGDDARSAALQAQALEIGRRLDDPTVTALALGGLARLALRSGEVDEARRLCREALAVTAGTADQAGRSGAMHVLAVAAQMAGDLLEARALMRERIALGRAWGNFAMVSAEASNLSMVERQLGELEQAERLAREALDLYVRRGDAWAIPYALNSLAAVATDRGEFSYATTLLGAAEAMMAAQGAAWPPDEQPHYQRTVTVLMEAMGPAVFEAAREAGRSLATPDAVAFALRPHRDTPAQDVESGSFR